MVPITANKKATANNYSIRRANSVTVIFQQLIRWFWLQVRHGCPKDKGMVARKNETVKSPDDLEGISKCL